MTKIKPSLALTPDIVMHAFDCSIIPFSQFLLGYELDGSVVFVVTQAETPDVTGARRDIMRPESLLVAALGPDGLDEDPPEALVEKALSQAQAAALDRSNPCALAFLPSCAGVSVSPHAVVLNTIVVAVEYDGTVDYVHETLALMLANRIWHEWQKVRRL